MLTVLIIIAVVLILIVALAIVRRRRKSGGAPAAAGGRDEAPNRQVYVGNLAYQVSESDLKEFFGKYGAIEQVRIVKNYSSGRSKGFGFVTYYSVNEAKKALAAHGQKYQGRTIVVRIAKPR